MACATGQLKKIPVAGPSRRRHFNLHLAVEIRCCYSACFEHFAGSPLKHNVSTFTTGFRAYVNDIVGFEHHVFVMFYHYDGVLCVAQFFQRFNQFAVVALVKAYARLVEDIQHIDQFRPQLCGQSDTLALTARQCG